MQGPSVLAARSGVMSRPPVAVPGPVARRPRVAQLRSPSAQRGLAPWPPAVPCRRSQPCRALGEAQGRRGRAVGAARVHVPRATSARATQRATQHAASRRAAASHALPRASRRCGPLPPQAASCQTAPRCRCRLPAAPPWAAWTRLMTATANTTRCVCACAAGRHAAAQGSLRCCWIDHSQHSTVSMAYDLAMG